MAELYTNYEGARGPRVKYKRAPEKSGNTNPSVLRGSRKLRGRK